MRQFCGQTLKKRRLAATAAGGIHTTCRSFFH
jgi:hypothetical protein